MRKLWTAVPAAIAVLTACTSAPTTAPSGAAAGTASSGGTPSVSAMSSSTSASTSNGASGVASSSPNSGATQTSTTSGTTGSGTLTHPARTATVALNGDLLWHNSTWWAAQADARREGLHGKDDYDFGPTLAPLKPFLADADLAICHNDIPVAPKGGPYYNYPAFSVPPQTVQALKPVGYDLCTTASNHMLDQGFTGLVRTVDTLEANGLQNAGAARTPAEADAIPMFTTAGGVKIAVLSGTYGTNGIPLPSGKAWCLRLLDPVSVHVERARKAKEQGADIVLAIMQAGDEYVLYPNAQQKNAAQALTASPDVDLVVNHHSHVVNPWTRINGKWVIYGLGNTVSQQRNPENFDGVLARLTFTEQTDGHFTATRAEYVPTMTTRYSGGPIRVLPVVSTIASGGSPYASVATLRASLNRTETRVAALGASGLIER